MAPLAALIAAFMAAAIPDAPGALPLRVVSDVAECPSRGEVQAALRQVLGEGQEAGGWTLWYGRDPAAPATERAANLVMELVDPAGERLTVRRIPTGDCAAIGTAMAAVVERSLRDLGWTQGAPLPESAGPKPSEITAAPAVSPTPQASPRDQGPRLVLGVGPLFATSSRLGTNLLIEARVRVFGPLCLRLGAAALSGSASESLGAGRVSLSSRTFSLAALGAFMLGPVEISGGPLVLLGADQASSSELQRIGSGTRAVLAVGGGIGVAVPLGKRWRVALELAGARTVFAPETYVNLNGTRTTVLTPPSWQGMAVAKLEFVPWP
jgi:hypothetical protein